METIDKSMAQTGEVIKICKETQAMLEKAQAMLEKALAQRDELRAALIRIERWHGEFPPAKLHDGTPCSYTVAYGSNGERDFIRKIARAALAKVPK